MFVFLDALKPIESFLMYTKTHRKLWEKDFLESSSWSICNLEWKPETQKGKGGFLLSTSYSNILSKLDLFSQMMNSLVHCFPTNYHENRATIS